MTILVCFAVKQEAQFFHSPANPSHRLERQITGIGRMNTEESVRAAVERCNPDLVFTCGFAGGLNPSLATGTVVFDADPGAQIERSLLDLKATRVQFHCATRIASTVAEKKKLRQETGADAVEMESAFIRRMCSDRNIQSATVRIILDSAAESLPLDFNKVLDSDYGMNYGKLIGRVLASPNRILGLIAFQRQTIFAARRLGAFLDRLVARL